MADVGYVLYTNEMTDHQRYCQFLIAIKKHISIFSIIIVKPKKKEGLEKSRLNQKL